MITRIKIIATNLRGERLEAMLAELLEYYNTPLLIRDKTPSLHRFQLVVKVYFVPLQININTKRPDRDHEP